MQPQEDKNQLLIIARSSTAATVSIGVSSTPLVPGDKETHYLEQYNFFWPICFLQTYDE